MASRFKHTSAILLLVLNVFNILVLRHHFVTRQNSVKDCRSFPQTLPKERAEPVYLSFERESAQYPATGDATDLEWLFLISENAGWARLGSTNRLFQPSFYHEVHCLRMLNLALSRRSADALHHSRHCLHYARSMALCRADVALEPVVHCNGSAFTWDVTRSPHQCADWPGLYRSMRENWADWKTRVQ